MDCGFRVVYGFTESDEISLLFAPEENAFGRKVRKYNSTLAGEASAAFSLALGQVATFDCRVVPLPTIERVRDYFLWRQEDAHRNSLNSHCYWIIGNHEYLLGQEEYDEDLLEIITVYKSLKDPKIKGIALEQMKLLATIHPEH